jgi:hypothetical protein
MPPSVAHPAKGVEAQARFWKETRTEEEMNYSALN